MHHTAPHRTTQHHTLSHSDRPVQRQALEGVAGERGGEKGRARRGQEREEEVEGRERRGGGGCVHVLESAYMCVREMEGMHMYESAYMCVREMEGKWVHVRWAEEGEEDLFPISRAALMAAPEEIPQRMPSCVHQNKKDAHTEGERDEQGMQEAKNLRERVRKKETLAHDCTHALTHAHTHTCTLTRTHFVIVFRNIVQCACAAHSAMLKHSKSYHEKRERHLLLFWQHYTCKFSVCTPS